MLKLGNVRFSERQSAILLFCCSWSVGFVMGTLLAVSADPSIFSRMRFCLRQDVLIPGLLIAALLPFLLSACAAVSSRELLVLILFCKAFTFAFFGAWVYLSFGSAGWLIRFLVQFSNILSAPAFCWFCIRHLNRENSATLARDLLGCLLYTTVIVFADYISVAPLLEHIVTD